jgi:hypothetical protein
MLAVAEKTDARNPKSMGAQCQMQTCYYEISIFK